MLLARRDGLVAVDQLVDELWPEKPASDPRMLVHGYVSRLRRALGPAASRLVTRKPGYQLQVAGSEWDVYRFEQSIADARFARAAGELERCIKLFAEAQKQWAGEPFADVPPTQTVTAEATALTELRIAALEESFEARLDAGSDPELITDLTHHMTVHPWREQPVAQLMRLLHRSGRRADALMAFRQTRERLVAELGVEPGAELQRIHQEVLRAVDIPDTAAAHHAIAQLPMAVPGFVGRRLELAALDQATSTVTVITGTAGVGKSSLAVHWAHRVQHRYPDGQLFLDLHGFDAERSPMDPGEALFRFLEALGVSPERIPAATDARAALYRSVLADRRVLVVLDNARDVEQVRPLLPGSPGSHAVVTSRDQLTGLLAIEGAHPVTLDVLTEVEAVDLLTARLGAARLGESHEALRRIVERCAGLPLALSVVAARCAVEPGFSLRDIASDLDTGTLDALGDADPRADLRSVFSWSLRALSSGAASLFRLLGLHPGPDISTDAAASLAGATVATARALLLELCRAQLVAQSQPGRYRSHDLLAAYACELASALDSQSRDAALSRLLDHYLHTSHAAARLLDPNREPVILDACTPGAITAPPATDRGAMEWFDAEHAVLVGMVHRTGSWKLAWTMSTFLRRKGHGRDWIDTQQAALAQAQRCGDVPGQANAAFQLAMAQFRYGRREAADRAMEQAVDHFTALNDHYGLASTYHLRCLGSERDEDYATAFSYARKGLEYYRLAGHPAGQGRALGAMGWFQAKQGNLRTGLHYCWAAMALSQESNDFSGAANVWDSIGHINLQLGELDKALDGYQRSTAVYRDLGDRYNLVHTMIGLGDTRRARGESRLAASVWSEALAIATELDHPGARQLRARLAS
jgi:DNA-binding SARP family transcriptional activator/tetratricopeptide (TPR) repeat protein